MRGALLREAIGLDWDGNEGASAHADGEWLRNMAVWGYPKGWTGERDPRYEVMRRIEGEVIDDSDEEEEEEVFLIFGDVGEQEEITFTTPSQLSPFNTVSQTSNEDPTPSPPKIHRWASYPNTHFSSALLPIYTGYALPPLSADPSPTFTSDRQALWVNVTSGNGPPQPPPPPPSTSPPPLPPPPDKPPLPKEELDGEAEMDFSDSD